MKQLTGTLLTVDGFEIINPIIKLEAVNYNYDLNSGYFLFKVYRNEDCLKKEIQSNVDQTIINIENSPITDTDEVFKRIAKQLNLTI